MPVTRANVEATKAFIRPRLGNPYVYGGALSANVKQGTDCSEVWQTVLEMVHGRWKPGRQSEGATTESYRRKRQGGSLPDGVPGPFGTIDVNHWREIPANAAAKLAFHHGPGGGANSHMWGELDGMRIESGGSKGLVTAPKAWPVDHSYATAWAYLPGPIADDGTPVPPAPPEIVTLGRQHESSGDRVRRLQEALNRPENGGHGLELDGEFGPMTETAVTAFQRSRRLEVDGVAGPITLAALGLSFGISAPSAPPAPAGRGLTAEVLRRIARNPDRMPLWRYEQLLPIVRIMLRDMGAHTIGRRAMAIAQTFHESGALYYKREIHDGSNYEGRCRDLGNCQPGDGRRFPGRGFIQLTGRAHAAGFSQWMHGRGKCPTPTWFADHPEQMETDDNAAQVVVYYWTVSRPQLNSLADAGDLLGATRAVNGGTNGLDDRRDFYARALAAGADLLDPEPADELEALLMSNLEVESLSIYATPGEPNIPITRIFQAIDAAAHRELVEDAARLGDLDSIRRIARTAAGLGKFRDPATITHAVAVLNQINAVHPEWITAATPGKATA